MVKGARDFNVSEKVQEAGLILGALGVIGFIGIIWLLIYGNLSGNLGFTQDTLPFVNETITLSELGSIPAGADNRVNGAIANSTITPVITNATGGEIINIANYSVVGVTIFAAVPAANVSGYNETSVNVTYSVSFDSDGQINTENVITNITGGFNTFFTFSNTFFTIAAIVLLIFMFMGLLAIVVMIMNMQRGKGRGFAEG